MYRFVTTGVGSSPTDIAFALHSRIMNNSPINSITGRASYKISTNSERAIFVDRLDANESFVVPKKELLKALTLLKKHKEFNTSTLKEAFIGQDLQVLYARRSPLMALLFHHKIIEKC